MKKNSKVVYSTTTGEPPKGSPVLTTEATAPLPPPTKLVRKTTVKKPQPRVVEPAKPLHRNIKVHQQVWAKAQELLAGAHGFTSIEIIDDTTVVVH